MSINKKIFLSAFALIITPLVFWPGMTGPFLLDDFSSLPQLFDTIELYGFWYAIFDGGTGPTGRPVSLFTFALQQSLWPNPITFKYVNLFIHLLNGVLIATFCYFFFKFIPLIANDKRVHFAIATAVLWSILPIQISTVLYVIQRMVLLSAFFTLLGLLLYLWGRQQIYNGDRRKGFILITIAVVVCGTLATFCKEVGFLLVFFILVCEITINRYEKIDSRPFIIWKTVFIFLPIAALCLYLISIGIKLGDNEIASRTFLLGDRLLTEPRVLWSYVGQIILPQPSSLSLFHDNYPLSTGIISPFSTLLALCGWIIVVFYAIRTRHSYPLFGFCVFWFLFGHIMEATTIPLEIYFEHRNYLPSFGVALGIILTIASACSMIKSKPLLRIFAFVALLYAGLIFSIAAGQSMLWGDEMRFASVQAKEHPNSIRARMLTIGAYAKNGQMEESFRQAKKIQADFPQVPATALYDMQFACYIEQIPLLPIHEVEQRLNQAGFDLLSLKLVNDFVRDKGQGKCKAISYDYLTAVIETLLNHPKFQHRRQELLLLLSISEMFQENIDRAIEIMQPIKNRSFDSRIHLTRLFATKENYAAALEELAIATEKLDRSRANYIARRRVLDDLRAAIRKDIKDSRIQQKSK